jgi:exopolyphosphatase/guanosine-5'-triphosphate,3'-diphosphate pyrophosphatase
MPGKQCGQETDHRIALNKSNDARSLAAIDLGSNSFHMIVGRLQNGQLQLIDRLREPVRLAEGLTDNHKLRPDVAERALQCLQRFGQRIRDLHPDDIRAVGTNTLRRAHAASRFLDQAQQALGHGIEIISGIEEARLVHLGVAHSLADVGGRRLVVDIGGGSTELIIGEEFEAIYLESLYMGCVSMSQRFFADGNINKQTMKQAVLAARLELQASKQTFRRLGWTMATGSSGTIRTVRDVVQDAGWSDNGITPESLKQLRSELINIGQAEQINFPAVSEDRKPVFAGGVAILSAVFQSLKIERMLHSSGALREGLLYDLLGRIQHQDIRESTVQSLAQRYHVDREQAQRVEETALALLDQVIGQLQLRNEEARQWLHWAALLHEIGLVIAHSQYHKHGAYLIEYSDLPGFSLRDQRFLSVLVRCHRRKFRRPLIETLPDNMHRMAIQLVALMRLAVLLRRNRSTKPGPEVSLSITEQSVCLDFPPQWLEEHPLTRADLDIEKKYLKPIGLKLEYS